MAHLDAGRRVRPQILGPPTQLAELPTDFRDVGAIDRVDREGRRDLNHMEERELGVLDLGHEGAEVDELHAVEVRDGQKDVIPPPADRKDRLDDFRHARDHLLVLVEVVDEEARADPSEGDEPGGRLDSPQADRDHELGRDAKDWDDGEERHHVVSLHVRHRPPQDDRGPVDHEEEEEEHDVRTRRDGVDVQGERDEDDDQAGDCDRDMGRPLARVQFPEDPRETAVAAHRSRYV